MKVSLTIADIKELLVTKLGFPKDFELEITHVSLTNLLEETINGVEALDFRVSQKIHAIKLFREKCSCGLAAAKAVIENWDVWKAAAIKKGDFPSIINTSGYNWEFN